MSETKSLYIVGHPVTHSKSPVMYNALYSNLGLPWHYDFMDIADASSAQKFLNGDDYLSVNITTPYKPEAFEAAEIKAASATLAKGVNLLINKEGHKLGYNVDGVGCVEFLEHMGIEFKDAQVVVCGTGPTALSILHACAQAGASTITLLGRDKNRACDVLTEYVDNYRHLASTAIPLPSANEKHLSFVEAYEHAEFKFGTYATSTKALSAADVIIDATVLGMKDGDPAPFDTSLLREGQVVLDTVYGHGTTALVAAARECGCRVFDGAGMLVSQAVLSATIVCEVENVELDKSYAELFDIMAKAANFSFEM